MTTIYADFNARTKDDRVRLTTVGSRESLAEAGVGPGAWVWLSDGEVRNGAHLEESDEGLVARVAWETTEDVVERVTGGEASGALRELRLQVQGEDRDYRRLLKFLPHAERALDPGRADYYRSRAAEAFGYPHLALLAIEDALQKSPSSPGFLRQRLELLKTIDLDRAFEEASVLSKQEGSPAVVLAACASVFSARVRQLDDADAAAVESALLEFTEHFERAPGFDTAPRSVAAMVYVTRAFALTHLGRQESALVEFNRAVTANPDRPEALAARGLETYPSTHAVEDLLRAFELGLPSFWPAYYLSHHFVSMEDWPRAERFARAAQAMDPPDRVRANLIEWEAIARFQQDGNAALASGRLRGALALAPGNEHLEANLAAVESPAARPSEPPRWSFVRDEDKRTLDLAA